MKRPQILALFVFAVLTGLVVHGLAARAAPFSGVPTVVQRVTTVDGASLILVELKGNEEGPVAMIHPGLIETAATFDAFVSSLYRAGYKVFIGHARYVGHGELLSAGAPAGPNGLAQVLVKDSQAFWDHLIARFPNRPLNLMGHSMGGAQIIAGLSDPARGTYYQEHVNAAVLMTAPHTLLGLPTWVKAIARGAIPLLERVQRIGVPYVYQHKSLFQLTRYMKGQGGPLRQLAILAEWTIAHALSVVLDRLIIDHVVVSPAEVRSLMFSTSVFSVDLLLDFARAALTGQFPVVMAPAQIHVPTYVIAAELDRLVVLEQQRDLISSLPEGSEHRWILLKNARHVDPAISNRMGQALFPRIVKFLSAPLISGSGPLSETLNVCELVLL